MPFLSSATLPSLLIFGPQSRISPEIALQDYRQELNSNPQLSVLREAVDQLPQFWQRLVNFDPSLRQVPGTEYLGHLRHWVKSGGSLRHLETKSPSHYDLAVTILLHVVQYFGYLHQIGRDAHCRILDSVKTAGVQGYCVGLLSAIAVASAKTEADIGRYAAIALRLAVCIGAYVDKDGAYSPDATEHVAVAVRWRQGSGTTKTGVGKIVESIPNAYVSSTNDEASVTVTIRATDLDNLVEKARENNLQVKNLNLYGRFHTMNHLRVLEKLTEVALKSLDLQLPNAEQLVVPVRDNSNSRVFVSGSLSLVALEDILVNVADWYSTLRLCIRQMPEANHVIACAGFGNCIPASLAQSSGLQILALGDSQMPILGVAEDVSHIATHGHPRNSIGVVDDHHTDIISNIDNIQESDDLFNYPPHSIAITGMAGRFPGADSVDELWDLIIEGKTTVQPAPVERLGLFETPEHMEAKWWGNFLNDPDAFDNKFFKKSSREALAWDPQQRKLLEVVYEALESASYFGASSSCETLDYGCYIGAVMNNYYDNLSCHPATAYALVGTSRSFLSGSMSHHFGWTGPSLTIDTACSSSLVAINAACRAIWSGECSRAVAGGTNIISSPFDYKNLAAAGFLSQSGQCKPFDADADGYCRGEAVAVVVLKPLMDAIAENDNVLGVIVGSATNQNRNCGQITAPNSASQVELYQRVTKMSGVRPESVSYVEAHGTGTIVGDPIEVGSIRKAFGGPKRESVLHFSSIKGNIGHTEATAGVAGLIKVLLMMRHGVLPSQASLEVLNPVIPAFDHDKMAIPRDNLSWKTAPFLAMVNSYGAAGSNAAVMVRQKPTSRCQPTPSRLSKYPLFISAGSAGSLSEYSKKLLTWLKCIKVEAKFNLLESLTFNLADRGNHLLSHVLAISVSSVEEVEAHLEAAATKSDSVKSAHEQKPVVMVFGGQETDFVGLSRTMFECSKVLRKHLDSIDDLLRSTGMASLYPFIFEKIPTKDLVALHTALFAVQYASAKAWIDCGLKVNAVVGHSFGQLTALCISGVLSLSDTLKLITGRASLMQSCWGPEPGSMLSMQGTRERIEEALRQLNSEGKSHRAEIACYNSPESCVVVGSTDAIESLQHHITNTLSLQGAIRFKRLNVTNGFHSRFTEPLLPHLVSLAQQIEWRCPTIHLETTEQFENNSAPDFRLVAEHTRRPVYFQQAIERLDARLKQCTWIEAGCGSSVIKLVRASVKDPQMHAFHSPQLISQTKRPESLVEITVGLWNHGYAVQFWPFHRCQKLEYEHLHLPPIQFEKTRHWLRFQRRTTDQEENNSESEKRGTIHQLLTFVSFRDETKNEAVFRIDPEADRFRQVVNGHVIAGQTLAPTSFYFEVVTCAALFLQDDAQASMYVPTVHDLHMRSPIGQSITKNISLILKRCHDAHHTWFFSIKTQEEGLSTPQPSEHATGKVSLKKRNDTQAIREFKRYETLVEHRRYEEIMRHPDAETMQGSHIYRAFNHIVNYGGAFRGIKQIANVGLEVVGKVRISPASDNLPDSSNQLICDTFVTDSFMQLAGFLVNYFRNSSMDDVFVCTKIEHIEIGGSFDLGVQEWLVYSTLSEDGGDHPASDVYVFDARTNKIVMTAFGISFNKMSHSLLTRILKNVNRIAGETEVAANSEQHTHTSADNFIGHVTKEVARPSTITKPISKRREILQLLSNITDLPVEELREDLALEDFGVDSLMATEVLNDIRSTFGVTIDLSSFLFFDNLRAIISHVDEKLGLTVDQEISNRETTSIETRSSDGESKIEGNGDLTPDTEHDFGAVEPDIFIEKSRAGTVSPTIISAMDPFRETRLSYDMLANTTQAVGFWEKAYPHQARLVLAHVMETFADLGCNITKLGGGDILPRVNVLERHTKLVRQLHRVLEERNLITSLRSQDGFVRTDAPIDYTSSEVIYHQNVDLYPQHTSVNKLIHIVGSEMAACLRGDKDALQVIFGKRDNKKALEEMYEFWPLSRTPTFILGDFLIRAFTTNAAGKGRFRILEVGAGTGSTTRHIVDRLRSLGIDFEYVFTDMSASLVNVAAKQFQHPDDMRFEALDIEQAPRHDYIGAFHCVIASNCVHATRNVETSLKNLRQMLRDDGFLTLIEITKHMFWLDIVFGLFEGWWLFEDGREHALIDENEWERRLKKAGFQEVLWSDGDTAESKTIRVIAAFPTSARTTRERTAKAVCETVVYKKVAALEIHADIYYSAEAEQLPERKMPIALMIHGGSHILFSRKDIRPAQTRLLLHKGFLPVSLDYRLCPETPLLEGAMVDVCDALDWARHKLPNLQLQRPGFQIDGQKVVVVGWSSGGQLAMSLGWTAPQRGLRPPEASLIFYAPTDYEDAWWQHPIHPLGAVYNEGQAYDLLEGVRDTPIANYSTVSAWANPIADPQAQHEDPRVRIVLHNNWKAQTLPVILNGLPSKAKAAAAATSVDWTALPQPSLDLIRAASPRAHIVDGTYRMPTFFVHGTADDLIPWRQSQGTYEAMVARGLDAEVVVLEGAPHVCDLSSGAESDEGWKAVLRGYEFVCGRV